MNKYQMNVKSLEKVFNVMVNGSFTNQDVDAFLKDYNKNLSRFAARDFSLLLDCKDLKVSTPDMLKLLGECYKMYMATGFKKVIFIKSSSAIVNSQLKRIADEVGLKASFVDSQAEAMNTAKG